MKDIDKYNNKYVVQESFTDDKIILSGDDPLQLHKEAIVMGIEDPVIFYVSDEPTVFGNGTYE
ncbi:hypothetical protein KAR91_51260 [Candidatus Pacearchaeota archaeon]|nr:hypothetical protein [Candidatus Pacearchaeota archaeon]